MPRQCGICASPRRVAVDAALQIGTVSEVASKEKFSASAIYRHIRHRSGLIQEARASVDIGTRDLVAGLADSLADIEAVKAAARVTGQGALLLRAVASQRDTTVALIDLLGVERTDVADQLQQGERLVRALLAVVREQPTFGTAVALKLRRAGDIATADDLDNIVTTVTESKGKEIS